MLSHLLCGTASKSGIFDDKCWSLGRPKRLWNDLSIPWIDFRDIHKQSTSMKYRNMYVDLRSFVAPGPSRPVPRGSQMSAEERTEENLRLRFITASVSFYDGPPRPFDRMRKIQLKYALYSELI
jgi:hypothetical protein